MLKLLLLLSFSALADVPPPNTEGCANKEAGDACQTDGGADGGCKTSTCTRLDYSNGTPPGSVEYECLICDTALAPDDNTICGVTGGPLSVGIFGLALALPLALRRQRG